MALTTHLNDKKRYIILVLVGVFAWHFLNKQPPLSYEVKESVLKDWNKAEDLSKKNGYDPNELKHARDLDYHYNA